MALVHTKGGTKKQRHRAQMIATWAAYELMHPRMADNIEINIDLCIPDGAEAFCTWADDNIKPREFDIEINKTLEGDDLTPVFSMRWFMLSSMLKVRWMEYYIKMDFRNGLVESLD